MSRTKGSGWGAGPLLYQVCPLCGKKKAYYYYNPHAFGDFKCTYCKEFFDSKDLVRLKYASQVRTKRFPHPSIFGSRKS